MGSKIREYLLRYLPGFLGGAIVIGATIGPEEATSNISQWLNALGIFTLPKWLTVKSADSWAFNVGFAIFVAWGLVRLGILIKDKMQNQTQQRSFFRSIEWVLQDSDFKVKLIFGFLLLASLWNLSLQQRVRSLEVEMIRYVLPRELTKDQIEKFGSYLKANSQPQEVRILYIMGDSESSAYAHDFWSAFRAGKWHLTMIPVDPITITCKESPQRSTQPVVCSTSLLQMINRLEGVYFEQTGPNPPHQEYIRDTVSAALKAAGIQGIGCCNYSNNNDPVNTITVFVGFRARHKFAVLPSRPVPEDSLDNLRDDDF